MIRDEWQRVKIVAAATLEHPEADRSAYITAACAGDEALERDVRSILTSMAKAADLFEAQVLTMPGATTVLSGTTLVPRGVGVDQVEAMPDRLPVGTLINGRYRVEGVAGEGGMGAVYRVADIAQSRTLALKAVRGKSQFVNLFKIEFRTLVALRHPHLAQSYDFEPIAGPTDYCFTMDFVEGRNIYDATDGMDWSGVVDLLVQMCRALAYVHNRGVVHRDIKPNNVLVQSDGTLKLVDFGLVGGGNAFGEAMGTPAYLAPESARRDGGDHRSDLYSLGIMAYQLLCRRLPFSAATVPEILSLHAHSPMTFPEAPGLPDWLKDVILRLCAKDPADRFRGANQVIEAINRLGGLSYPIETAATRESYVVSGRFVGRQDELFRLTAFVEQRLGSEPTAIGPLAMVTGQSGVGKSRLVLELRHELQLNRRIFVEGNCFEGAAAEYGAFGEAIAQLALLADSRAGAAFVERYLGELVKIAPALGRERTFVASPALTTPEAERWRLLDTVATFLVDVSRLFAYVLYLNDLQWAPNGTIDILRNLHRRIGLMERQGQRVPLACLGSYRDDEVAARPLEDLVHEIGHSATVIHLDPLSATAMQRLLGSMFGLDDIPASFVARVLDEATGSPFFLEEVVRALVENGSVFVEAGAWRTAAAVGDLEIPANVIAALRRRVAMISRPEELEVLRLLAAYKKPMSASLLSAITGTAAEEIEVLLFDLSARHMVAFAVGPEPLYRTAHDRLRTTVYADIGPETPALHGRIAQGLERAVVANPDPPLSELAHHYWLAQDWDPALAYALRAGRSALSVYANDEAIEHLQHALALLPADRSQARTQATEQLADAYFLAGRYEQTKSLLIEVDRSVDGTIDKARVQRKLAEVVAYSAGAPGDAVDILWKAAGQLGARRPGSRASFLARTVAALARHFLHQWVKPVLPVATGEPERAQLTELATIYLRIGHLSFFADPVLFLLPVLRAATVVDRVGESKTHSQVYSMAALALGGLGFTSRAIRYGANAIAEAERTGSAWHLATARSFHAIVLLQAGHWQRALEHAERARDTFAACGDHFELAISVYHMLEVLHARGELRMAKARGREELAVFERLGLHMIGKGVFTLFGRILAKTGDVEGLAVGQEMLGLAARGADQLSTAFAHIALGDSLLHLARIDDAIEHLERGLAIRDSGRFYVYVVAQGSALLVQAYAARLRASGEPFDGAMRQSFDRHVSEAARAGRRFTTMRSSARLARGLQYRFRGHHKQAVACFEEAARLARGLGARLWEADARLENGLALLEGGERADHDARAELETALALYRACGAEPSERRALDALAGVDAT